MLSKPFHAILSVRKVSILGKLQNKIESLSMFLTHRMRPRAALITNLGITNF